MSPAPADEVTIAERVDAECDRFEAAFAAGPTPRLEEYLGDAVDPLRISLFRGLLELELELRRRRGDAPQRDEYAKRFPQYAAVVELVFVDFAAGSSRRTAARATADSSVKAVAADTSQNFAPAPQRPPEPPQHIARFQIRQLLGEGSFGAVYRAHDPQLERDVALKLPHIGSLASKEERERFLREARSSAALHHPHICPVHEVGVTPDGRDYIVMAFIDGKTLAKVLQSGGKLTPRQIASVVRKLALALEEAHQKGVIHRDLKPGNVMINRKGEPVIMDFGLARRSGANDPQLSVSGQIMGTPAYMSPEQARGDSKAVGPASDIYSLGVMLFEMLCGQRPFSGTVTEVIGQILHVDVPRPSQFRPDVDPRLEAICLKALARRPADRYASMKDFAAALADYLKAPATSETTGGTATAAVEPEPHEPLHTKQLARLVDAVADEVESKINRAASRAVRRAKRTLAPPWWTYCVGSAVVGLIVLFGIFFLIRRDGYTVLVEIHVPSEMADIHDPRLTFELDGKGVTAAELDGRMRLTPGEHTLVIYKDGEEFKRIRLDVGKTNLEPPVLVDVTPAAKSIAGPRLEELRELQASVFNPAMSPLPDGQTIYWEGRRPKTGSDVGGWVWMARRPNPSSPFGDQKELFPGRQPSVTADQLEMIFVRGTPGASSLRIAQRNAVSEPWVPGGHIEEFAGLANAKCPAISEDGLTLAFEHGTKDAPQLATSTRKDRASPWSAPQPLPLSPDPALTEQLTWPFLSSDGLTLWYCHGGGLSPEIRTATRADRQAPFGNHQPVIVDGKPLVGRAPRYVASTGELFFTRSVTEQPNDWSLWVVKNYQPPRTANAEDGFVSLFNGKDLAGWKATPGGQADWRVENGILVAGKPGFDPNDRCYLVTERSDYANYHLRVEALLDGSSDSGVMCRLQPFTGAGVKHHERGYEVQLCCAPEKKVKTGGLYVSAENEEPFVAGREERTLAKADQWFTLEVIAQGDRIITRVNGVPSADYTDPKQRFASGLIGVQFTRGAIKLRKIEVRELPPEDGFVSLFNGRDLAGWQGAREGFEVVDGVLRCKPGHRGTLYTADQYDDFAVQLDFRLTPGGNHGLALRYSGEGDPAENGLCGIQMFDSDDPKYRNMEPRHVHGSAYGLVGAQRGHLKPAGEWNSQLVTVRGTTVKVELNGAVILDTDLALVSKTMTGKPYLGKNVRRGYFGLCAYDHPVEFRSIRIQRLSSSAASDEQGFVSLLNGQDLAGWRVVGPATWTVRGGAVFVDGGKPGQLVCQQEFENFELTGEVFADAKGNGGVCARVSSAPNDGKLQRGGYEFQVAGSQGDPGGNFTGGLYADATALSTVRPPIIADRTWATIRLRVDGTRLQGWVNGQPTFDVDGKPKRLEGRLLTLQSFGQGGEVGYRNLRIRPLTEPSDADFVPLFNGKDLTGWKMAPGSPANPWRVENGILTADLGQPLSLLVTERGDYRDVHVRAVAMLESGAGGVKVRTPFDPNPFAPSYTVNLVGERQGAAKKKAGAPPTADRARVTTFKPNPGKWVALEIIVRGFHVTVLVDGQVIEDYDDPERRRESGHIGLPWGPSTKISFRKIKVRELPSAAAADLSGTDPDRAAAEWVLSVGGKVRVNDERRELKAIQDLPAAGFRLASAALDNNRQATDAELSRFRGCRHLWGLGLGNTPVSDDGLANFAHTTTLVILGLGAAVGNSRVTDAGLAHFRNNKGLRTLYLYNTLITDAGLAHFADCKQLEWLDLINTRVTDAGLAPFRECLDLKVLTLGYTQVTNDGLAHFQNSTQLTELLLFNTAISDQGLVHLTGLKSLKKLDLKKTRVTAEGVNQLHQALPQCRIDWDGGVVEPTGDGAAPA